MAVRKTPGIKGPNGRFVPQVDAAERRAASARMRSAGAGWREIADKHWGGDMGLASRQVKQFWADQPKETVEEIRATMLTKLDGLEQEARAVMARRHYVVAEGRIVQNHGTTCERLPTNGDASRCSCPKLVDDKPIYDGIDRVRQLVETQLKLIPGLAAPKRMEVLDDDAIRAEIDRARAELDAERIAAQRIIDSATAGDAGGTASAAEGSG